MKKIGIFLDRKLQELLESSELDEVQANVAALSHILSLLPFVIEMGVSRDFPTRAQLRVCAPVGDVSNMSLYSEEVTPIHARMLTVAFYASQRIQAVVYPGIATCLLGVNIVFHGDSEHPILLTLQGCADSMGVRYLKSL